MRIIDIGKEPIDIFPFLNVPTGGERDENGNRITEQVNLEIYQGLLEELPQELDALLVTSDLQGKVREGEGEFLLGEKLPQFLAVLIALEFPNLKKERIGVILCGDLYATLAKRGGRGDVKEVWRAFKKEFKWVAGVAGNHDDFGSTEAFEAFNREEGIYFIEKGLRKVDNLVLGGISGIIGRPDKPNRIMEKDYLSRLKQIVSKQPEAILLHQSPNYPPLGLMGEAKIREVLQGAPSNLLFCGHSHWTVPLIEFENKTQVLNVDSRVVLLINPLKHIPIG